MNPLGNPIGNTIDNPIGNTIGSSIGNSIKKKTDFPHTLFYKYFDNFKNVFL